MMTMKQLKARRLRKLYERERNIQRRNTPKRLRLTLHTFSYGNKRPYRLYNI